MYRNMSIYARGEKVKKKCDKINYKQKNMRQDCNMDGMYTQKRFLRKVLSIVLSIAIL